MSKNIPKTYGINDEINKQIETFVNNANIKDANYILLKEELIEDIITKAKNNNIKITKTTLREAIKALEKAKKEQLKEIKAENEKKLKEQKQIVPNKTEVDAINKEINKQLYTFVKNRNIKDTNYTLLKNQLIEDIIIKAKKSNIKINKATLREAFKNLEKEKQENLKKVKAEKEKKLKEQEEKKIKEAQGDIHNVNIHWYDLEVTNKGNKIITSTWQNAKAVLDAYNINVKYNVISREIEFDINNKDLKYIEKSAENARLEEIRSLFILQRYKINYDTLNMQLNAIADRNSYNPVKDYLKKAEEVWDGTDRLKDLYETVEADSKFSNELKELYIRKWLLNCVRQVHNASGKYGAYGVLVFQGRQNLGKTRWIKQIIPNQNWLKGESNINIESKDSLMENTKYWVVELGELDASMKNEQSKMKAFITREMDEFRKPYAKLSERYPRYTTFYASVNPKQFLKDETGNRRYWVIPCTKLNSNHNIDVEQLWGQIMHLYKKAEESDFYLTDQEVEVLNNINKEFTVSDDVDVYLEDMYDFNTPKDTWTSFMPASTLLDLLKAKDNKISAVKLKNALNKKGIEQVQPRYEGKKTRGYYLPAFTETEINKDTQEIFK